jgi:hypothetical protein
MGRTGRSREGRCVLLLTEAEGKKYSQAKDKYLQIQHLIARGDSIRYHHLVPSVLPENYRPAMLQQKITIPAVHEYTTDGKMKESTMDAFINSFPGHLHSLDALVGYYWPHKTKLNTMISIQRNLQCTHRVPHSKTTKYFTTCMRRMESRIHHRQPILKRGPVVMAGGPTKKRRD